MGQILHGRATTTHAVRSAIQNSQESIRILAARYNINPKTVIKWKKRTYVQDSPMGPKEVKSTVLTPQEEAIIVAFRKHTLLALDDCLYALQEQIPHLTRSSLHRCFQRHGISRLPVENEQKEPKKKFNQYPIGYFHIDISEVSTQEGKLYLIVAIDRVSKYTYVELTQRATKVVTSRFLKNLLTNTPYKIHTVLTDNGIQFTNRRKDRWSFMHVFDRVCKENNIEHRLTKVNHPWTNGQVERMNQTIKKATVNTYYYQNHETLKSHLDTFLLAHNHAKRLKALKGLTPYEFIVNAWNKAPNVFNFDPIPFIVGPNS